MFVLNACSDGGSSTGPTPGFNASPPAGTGDLAGRALLPTGAEPNSIGLQLAQSDDGVTHATYADIEGRVFYARCGNNCGLSDAWQSVEVAAVDVRFSGYAVARLELDSNARPLIAFHSAPGTFDPGATYFAQCDSNCLNADNWESALVIEHGGNLLEFQLAQTDWFALDPSGIPVIAVLLENSLIDTDKRLRLYSCISDCLASASWSQRVVATYSITSARPVSIDIDPQGQYHLATHIESIGADAATLTWFGCTQNCLGNGQWSNGVPLQSVETDLDSLPQHSLAIRADNAVSLLSFDDADTTTLTLHTCESGCEQSTQWENRNINNSLVIPGGMYDAGYGIDARYFDNTLELAYAAKATNAPLRQLVVQSRCENSCRSVSDVWTSQIIAQVNEQLPDQPICGFIGTRIVSALSFVTNAIEFTASPQWACGLPPVVVTNPDGEQFYDFSADVRFLEFSTVVTF